MTKIMVLSVLCGVLVVSAVLWLSTSEEQRLPMRNVAHAEEASRPPPLETNALICPTREDFPEELPEGIWLPPRRTEKLRPLHHNSRGRLVEVEGALGAGRGSGPRIKEGVNVPQHPSKWYSSIRYIVYKTPEAARVNAFKETILLMASIPRRGSFSGAEIGDLCGRKSSPFSHTLHFVRDCISVEIWAHVRDSYHYDEPLQKLIQNVLEITAKVIVKRVDGIVAVKGKVDMTNLPPVRSRTVDKGGGSKEAPWC